MANENVGKEKQCGMSRRQLLGSAVAAGAFTETVVMGNLAMLNLYKVLKWDGENMKFTNDETANEFVNSPYRAGWTL